MSDLFIAGWGEESCAEAARVNRVHVTLSRLRKLGLGEALQRSDFGYALNPDLLVLWADP